MCFSIADLKINSYPYCSHTVHSLNSLLVHIFYAFFNIVNLSVVILKIKNNWCAMIRFDQFVIVSCYFFLYFSTFIYCLICVCVGGELACISAAANVFRMLFERFCQDSSLDHKKSSNNTTR